MAKKAGPDGNANLPDPGKNSIPLPPGKSSYSEIQMVLAYLKRETPNWPPMGIDWPLVLSNCEGIWSFNEQDEPNALARPLEGQEIREFIGQGLGPVLAAVSDSVHRVFAIASMLLDVFPQLEAFCKASLAIGYDLDQIERPVKELPPYHALMCMGWPLVDAVCCFHDLGKGDLEMVANPLPEPVKFGNSFGKNVHHAIFNLASEICAIAALATEGKLAMKARSDQPEGTTEDAWAQLCKALEGRFPDALETKWAKVQLEAESHAAFTSLHSNDATGPSSSQETLCRPSHLNLRQPSEEAFAIYRFRFATGMKQIEMAQSSKLMTILGRPVSQGAISRSLNAVKTWIEAGNVLPDLPVGLNNKPLSMDPSQIDIGRNAEGRSKRQRKRRISERDD
jgi:hypothetical protein